METVTIETGAAPLVRVVSIGGDLRLTGREGTVLEAKASARGSLSARNEGDGVEVSCRTACLVFLPAGARVQVGHVGGDARVTGLTGEVEIQMVGGDLVLRRVGKTVVERVGGDLVASRVVQGLAVRWIGGDASLENIDGEIVIESLGGDLSLDDPRGSVRASAGGDVSLRLRPTPGHSCTVEAGGDLACSLPSDASVQLVLQAGGDLDVEAPVEAQTSPEGTLVQLGAGEARARLTAGGDLALATGEHARWRGWEADLGEQIRTQVEAEMEAALAQVEANLGAMEGIRLGFDPERFAKGFRRASERAQRRAHRMRERMQAKADRSRAKAERGLPLDLVGLGSKPPLVSEEERLSVLKMLEDGTITAAEAEKLLQALEGTG